MSCEDLASKAEVSITTISNINSEKNLPTIHLLLQIAEALNVDIREMFVHLKKHQFLKWKLKKLKNYW